MSEADAIALSAELVDIAIKIRSLEAKYNIQGNGVGLDLGSALLSALRPHANSAKVVANMHRASLSFDALEINEKAVALATSKLLAPSGYAADLWQRQATPPTPFSRQISPGLWERQLSSDSQVSQWSHLSSESFGDFSAGARTICLTPTSSSTPEKWSSTLEVALQGQVRHMRRQLARSLKLPYGKIILVNDADSGETGVGRLLNDSEPSAKASRMNIANLSKSSELKHTLANELTRELALTLQQDILAELCAPGRQERILSQPKDCLAEAQSEVLQRHGFQHGTPVDAAAATSHSTTMVALLTAFDNLALDLEVARVGDAINDKLGFRPQSYAISQASTSEIAETIAWAI